MKPLLFMTSNERKIREADSVLGDFKIEFITRSLHIDEIQHSSPAEVTKAKARAAYEATKEPVVVQDTSWAITALNGFPGAYMKDVTTWFSDADWLHLMSRHEDKSAEVHEHIVYYDGDTMEHFSATQKGFFVDTSRGKGTLSIDRVVVFEGNTDTLAEVFDRGGAARTEKGYEHWRLFAEWYSKRKP